MGARIVSPDEKVLFGPAPAPEPIPAAAPNGAAALNDSAEAERTWLDETSWVDVWAGFINGAPEVYEAVRDGVTWRQGKLWRYERWVDEPRLGASWNPSRPAPHPVLVDIHRKIQWVYGHRFGGAGIARYRDGTDGQAFHRDREMRYLDDTVIAILTLGTQRPFLMRPVSARTDDALDPQATTRRFAPAPGDLLVMGGRSQADWQHSVPKVFAPIGERISLQWRWSSGTGRPVEGPGYRAPRNFGDKPR